ncbi:MAG: siderophore biosynthesis protein [Actinomycetota bacterium]|nr:siderophore biosynthesis protein [Actinomycetota bacterium]
MTPDPDLIERALRAEQFEQVRRRLFRQLLESLLYEGTLVGRSAEDGRSAVDGIDEHGDAVSYLFTATRRYGFDRVRLGPEPVLRCGSGGTAEADSTTRLLSEVRGGLRADATRVATFARELEETLIKDTLAQYLRARRGGLRWLLCEADYDALESAITEGHPYHPAYKSRIGFNLTDNLAWGPEFAQAIHPLWLAAHRSTSMVSVSTELHETTFLCEQLGSATVEKFQQRICQAGGDPADYTFVPVHPWQWREHVSRVFATQLRNRELVVLGEDPHAHLAQQSLRTLACRDIPERAYLKLALSIVNTSTSRVLAPYTVGNAPLISDWLRRVVTEDGYLREELRLIVLGEVMGVAVDPAPVSELVRADTYGVLACIWRQSLHLHLEPGEQAVPFNGLAARELDGTPLVEPWVRALGVRQWLEELIAVTVVPLVHLLQGHGIALEAHAQNMVLVHSHGRPRRLAVRDFHDGVRFSRTQLANPALCPELATTPAHHMNPNSFVETDEPDLVTDFLLDALLFINLGELAILLADVYGFDEQEFWAVVRGGIEAYHRRFPELSHRFVLFDVFKPTIAVEQLTTRRLLAETTLRLHAVSNPLCNRATR